MYQKCMKSYIFSQISNYFKKILSRYQFGFRKGHSTQQCLLVMIGKQRQSLRKREHYGAPLTDLLILSHDLLIEKLHAYGFDMPALRLLHNYLTNRRERLKINRTSRLGKRYYLAYYHIIGPFLFNIFYVISFLS